MTTKNQKAVTKTLKRLNENVFKVTEEHIYAITNNTVAQCKNYKDFLKFAKKHPDKVFTAYDRVMTTVKKVKRM